MKTHAAGEGQAERNAREEAAKIIARWLKTGNFPDRLIEPGTEDRAFVTEVVYGVVKWWRQLDWILRKLVRRRPDEEICAYLFVGLYQSLHMTDVADYASVNETVEAVKRRFPGRVSDFANAVLRQALREKATIFSALREQPMGVAESHPDLLIDRWSRAFGEDKTRKLCAWNNGRANIVLRINAGRTSLAACIEALKAAGVEAAPHPFSPGACLALSHGVRVASLPGYSEGLFNVQDPSTIACVDLLNPRPGEAILDGCAAPGGKTLLIAERMDGRGTLVAVDAQEDRVARLRENLDRLRVGFAVTLKADIAHSEKILRQEGRYPRDGGFDGVLLDVPCSNTGVLRRRPDARWRFTLRRLGRLKIIQRAILEAGAAMVKPGGRVVYSTCSLEPEECAGMAGSWAAQREDFTLVSEIALFPPETQTDGAYAAVFRRER